MEDPTTTAALPLDPTTFCNAVAALLEPRHQAIAALRAMADLLEANPLWATKWQPEFTITEYDEVDHRWTNETSVKIEQARRHMTESARVLKKGQPIGSVRKVAGDYDYSVQRPLVGDIDVRATATRSLTCSMIPTDEVERVAVVEVPEKVAAGYTRYVDRPVMERVCAELLMPGYEAAS